MADPTMFPWFSESFFIHSWLLSLHTHTHTHKHFLVCSWTLCQQQQTNDRTQVRFYSGRRDCGCHSGVSAFPAATPQTTPATLTLNCLFILDGECAPVTLNVTMRMSWNLFLDPLQYPQMAFLCAAHNRDSSRGFWQDFSWGKYM